MRLRTFLLILVVLLVVGAAVAYVVFTQFLGDDGPGPLADLLPDAQPTQAPSAQEPGEPAPTATPATQFTSVVVARARVPIGQRLTADLLTVESRPNDNVAVQAGATFDSIDQVVGQITRTEIAPGQEVMRPMLALNPTDLSVIGSDLALYVDRGRVAVAFPITRYSGAAYAMRPGDSVDILMSLSLLRLDEEFQTARPNNVALVDQLALTEGQAFLFSPQTEGRLELVAEINAIAQVQPGVDEEPIARRVTQLTLQQAQVLWVGTWFNPATNSQEFNADALIEGPPPTPGPEGQPVPVPTPTRLRPESRPDLVILSLTAQDALVLKWALEVGLTIDLVLRAQGDNSVFFTTSVSLPMLVEQAGLTIPEPLEFGLEPAADEVPVPQVPPLPPEDFVPEQPSS